MASNPWDESEPLGTTAANQIDDIVRALKKDIRERMEGGGHIDLEATSGINATEDWKHVVNSGYSWSVFSSVASGATNEVYRVRSAAGTDLGAGTGLRIRRSVTLHIPGTLVDATDYSPMWRISIPNLGAVTILSVHADVATAPSGNLTLNVMRYASDTDYSAAGTDILNSDLTVLTTDNYATSVDLATGEGTTPLDGTVYRVRVTSAASASSLSVSIVYDYYERGF